jgi:hypothetical protein
VRGSLLSDPAVVGYLQPYLVVNWEGPDHTEPDEIRQIIQQAPAGHGSNVSAYVLSPDGQVLAGFHPDPWRDGAAELFVSQLRQLETQASASAECRPLVLPGAAIPPGPAGTPGGVRLFLSFPGEFNAPRPVVEAVALSAADRAVLRYPETGAAPVEARALATWLSRAYPPAMMDQDDRVDALAGTLTLSPTGDHQAVLSGQVQFLMRATGAFAGRRIEPGRNPRDFTYVADVNILLNYLPHGGEIKDFRGYLSGVYYRPDRRHGANDPIGINAAVESLPAHQ